MDHADAPLHYGDVLIWDHEVIAMALTDPDGDWVGVYLSDPGPDREIGSICHTLVGLHSDWSHWEVLSCTATGIAGPTSGSGSPS